MLFKRILFLVPVLLSAYLLRAEYFTIKEYHVDVTFTEEGQAIFEEVIEVDFSQPRHGIFRFIPYRDLKDGKSYTRIIKNIEVAGYPFSKSKENSNLVLKIGDPDTYVDGRQTYRIKYTVINPFNFFEENIELYWDLLGTSWPVPVERFSFDLHFPDNVQLELDDVVGYTGVTGTQGKDLTLQVSGSDVHGETTRVLAPNEAVTIAVRLDKGTFEPVKGWEMFLALHSLLLVAPIFLLVGILALFYARNRRLTIMTEYFPPDGLSPAVAGGFVDHSVDNNDVLSLIPHLANKGYLRMEATEGRGFFKKNKITFFKMKDAGKDLTEFEEYFFNALFAGGDMVELDDLKDKFYTHMASVKASVKEWIKAQGWYEPDQKALGCVTALIGFVALGWGAYALFVRQNLDGIALGVAGLILFYFANRFNKRSPAGNKTYQKLEGFRRFVAKAEKPVIERLLKDDPFYYDKTMPFALAFGYLKEWNRHFEGLLTQPPSWYSSPMIYGTDLSRSWSTFSESFPSEMSSIGSVFSSTPSSSGGGGGFGGGGSSGGGSGGGGGGSW